MARRPLPRLRTTGAATGRPVCTRGQCLADRVHRNCYRAWLRSRANHRRDEEGAARLPKALDEGHLRAVLVPQPKNASPPRRPAPFARRGRSGPPELGGLEARGRTSNVTSTSQRCRAYRLRVLLAFADRFPSWTSPVRPRSPAPSRGRNPRFANQRGGKLLPLYRPISIVYCRIVNPVESVVEVADIARASQGLATTRSGP